MNTQSRLAICAGRLLSVCAYTEIFLRYFRVWKRTTTHTVLRRLCDKGLFQTNNGVVTSLLSRQEFYARHSKKYVDETFAGSLPAFLAAFTSEKKLTAEEIAEIRELIDKAGE